MLRVLVVLACLLTASVASAQLQPAPSADSTADKASGALAGRCFDAATRACLIDDNGYPILVPFGATVRLFARGDMVVYFTQAAIDDLYIDTDTATITDTASASHSGDAVVYPMGAGNIDYQRMEAKSFARQGSVLAVGARDGVCETTAGVESRRPCRQDSDCITPFSTCDTTPGFKTPGGGFVCAAAAASAFLCVTWY
ncbi:hypothetical protein Rctr197k_052 [Virus Rctr197k]|nr:hypothetical protein Rctr197k_052 [Virus Rctr197k]